MRFQPLHSLELRYGRGWVFQSFPRELVSWRLVHAVLAEDTERVEVADELTRSVKKESDQG